MFRKRDPAELLCERIGNTWPGEALVNPNVNSVNPNANSVNPNVNSVNPNANSVNPNVNSVNPNVNSVNPNANSINPNGNSVNPNANSGYSNDDYGAPSPLSIASSLSYIVQSCGAPKIANLWCNRTNMGYENATNGWAGAHHNQRTSERRSTEQRHRLALAGILKSIKLHLSVICFLFCLTSYAQKERSLEGYFLEYYVSEQTSYDTYSSIEFWMPLPDTTEARAIMHFQSLASSPTELLNLAHQNGVIVSGEHANGIDTIIHPRYTGKELFLTGDRFYRNQEGLKPLDTHKCWEPPNTTKFEFSMKLFRFKHPVVIVQLPNSSMAWCRFEVSGKHLIFSKSAPPLETWVIAECCRQ